MAAMLHPGVYVQELPGPQLITAAATSNTAFVGLTEIGPSNQPTLITSWPQYVATFGGFMWGCQLPFAVYAFFAQGGAIAYVVGAAYVHPSDWTSATYTDDALTITAAAPGTWGNSLYVTIDNYPPTAPGDTTQKPVFAINVFYQMEATGALTVTDQIVAQFAAVNKLQQTTINGETAYLVETFAGFSAADMQKNPADLTQPSKLETRINATSLFIRANVATAGATRPDNVAQQQLSNGGGDPVSTPIDIQTALSSLDTIDNISLLVTPGSVSIGDYGLQRDAVQQAITYCEGRPRKDLFYIADPPIGLTVQEIASFKTGSASTDGVIPEGSALHSSYGAIYYPWIMFLETISNLNVPIPPSGAMAGTYAATDLQIGPWQVAAGITYGALNIATGVERIVTSTDQDVLNPIGVNAIRSLVNYGILAYGGRTLTTDPSLIYISVRRLLIEIEVSLYSGLQWVVFEPNTQRLWGAVTRDVTEFLTALWRAGALFGATADDAFQVQCDAGNNPPDQQARGILIVDIKVRPVFPAEFVLIRIQQATLGTG